MKNIDGFANTELDGRLARPVLTPWALHLSSLIDGEAPGFVTEVIRSPALRRHAIFAVLAVSFGPHLDEMATAPACPDRRAAMKALGTALMAMRPRDALSTAFDLPTNFEGMGTLSRLIEPLEPDDYIDLMVALCDPTQRRRQQALQHIPRIDHDRLRGVLNLEPTLCSVRLARKVRSERDAKLANDVLAVVRMHRPDLTETELQDYTGQGDPMAPLNFQLERLLGLVKEIPPLSIPVPEGFRHLRTHHEFEDCGRRFRNCLVSKFLDTAVPQTVVFLEYLPKPAIAALLPTTHGLLLSQVHAPGNAAPAPDLVEEVRVALAASSIGFITPAPLVGPLASVRYALMKHDVFGVGHDIFGVGHDGFDHWGPD